MLRSQQQGFLYVLLASLLWGTTGTAQALAPEGAQPLMVGTLRLLVGGSALLLVYALWPKDRTQQPAIRMPARLVLAAAACMAAYQVLFFAGVALTGVAVGTIVGIGSSPVLAGVLGYLLRGEKPGWRWGAATLLAIAGCAILALNGAEIDVDPLGMLLAAGAGAAYATFSLVSKGLLEHQPVEKVMAAAFFVGALLLAPVLAWQIWAGADLRWLAQPNGWGVILHLGLVSMALAYTLFGRGLRLVPLATAVTLSLAEPVTAGLLGVLVLGERLSPASALGIALVLSGLVVLSFNPGPVVRQASPGNH
jgi:drug/metabolite transporter, DME family